MTIIDNRDGSVYEVQVKDGAIKATDLWAMSKTGGMKLRSFDPAY